MIKTKMYKYIGRNGILTTRILLDGINRIDLYSLAADEGMRLTNDEVIVNSITIEVEDLDQWYEIPAPVKDD